MSEQVSVHNARTVLDAALAQVAAESFLDGVVGDPVSEAARLRLGPTHWAHAHNIEFG